MFEQFVRDLLADLDDACIDVQLEAWQTLANTGIILTLPNWYGRTVMQLIDQDLIRDPLA
jgi:hypothetical protein